MKKEKNIEILEMSVKEYLNFHYSKTQEKINRHDVYRMIKEGKLKAHKGYKNAWVLEIEVVKKTKKPKTYTVKEFVESYNKKHKDCITVLEVRKMIKDGIIKGDKVKGKWLVMQTPSKRIK